jgi:hypothetical protein
VEAENRDGEREWRQQGAPGKRADDESRSDRGKAFEEADKQLALVRQDRRNVRDVQRLIEDNLGDRLVGTKSNRDAPWRLGVRSFAVVE